MKNFFAVTLLHAVTICVQVTALTLDVPPLDLGGLSGAALTPQFNGPRLVTIWNPKVMKSSRRRQSTQQKTVQQPSTGIASAIYTMVNSPGNGNYVASYNIFPNGSIDTSGVSGWGGKSNQIGGRFKQTGSVYQDALDSQSPMVQAGSRLFLVNAGSGTFTTYAINCTNPSQLIELGTVNTNGGSPNTLAVAIENQIVCVATTGSDAGIECYTFDAGFQTINPPQYFAGTNVSLPLPVQQLPGTPTGPPDTVSQLIFTDDEKYLLVVVKSALDSNGNVASPGYINVYPMTSKGLGQPVQSTPASTQLLFGCTFQYNTYNLFCADAGVGTFAFTMSSSTLQITTMTNGMTAAQQINPTSMNCWTARSKYSNGPYYATAVNENYIAAFKQPSGKYITTHNFTNGNPQLIEMATANNFVYALSYGQPDQGSGTIGPHLTVARDLNLAGGFSQVQNIALPAFSINYEGMAVFIPSDEANICDFT